MKQQAEENFKQDHKFKPVINKQYKGKKRDSSNQEERIDRLAEPKNHKNLMRD
jgi:hypothetical protein